MLWNKLKKKNIVKNIFPPLVPPYRREIVQKKFMKFELILVLKIEMLKVINL